MENGAKGCEIIISGKLRGARAKAMKFKDGYMVKSGFAVNMYVDEAVRHLLLKQGILGIKVRIMLPHDPTGKNGPAVNLSDVITIKEPKSEEPLNVPPKQGFAQQMDSSSATPVNQQPPSQPPQGAPQQTQQQPTEQQYQ